MKDVVRAFCFLHKIPSDDPIHYSNCLENFHNDKVNVWGGFVSLGESLRCDNKIPCVWIRGNRVYDLDGDRGSIEEFITDCNNHQKLDIMRPEIRQRRAKAGLPPCPYAPGAQRVSNYQDE